MRRYNGLSHYAPILGAGLISTLHSHSWRPISGRSPNVPVHGGEPLTGFDPEQTYRALLVSSAHSALARNSESLPKLGPVHFAFAQDIDDHCLMVGDVLVNGLAWPSMEGSAPSSPLASGARDGDRGGRLSGGKPMSARPGGPSLLAAVIQTV